MKLLSLDLSTKSTGWAIFENGILIDSGCITSTSLDLIKRIQVMAESIKNIIINNLKIDKIIVEEVRPETSGVSNIKTHRALMWLQAGIAFMLHDNFKDLEMEYIYPSSWRSAIGIKTGRGVKRTTLKQADIDWVKANFGKTVNDDEADAIGIGYASCHDTEAEINWE